MTPVSGGITHRLEVLTVEFGERLIDRSPVPLKNETGPRLAQLATDIPSIHAAKARSSASSQEGK
jgi:hypothetical protein